MATSPSYEEELLAIFEKDVEAAYLPQNFDKSQVLNRTFHETILEAAQNETAARIVDNLRMLAFVSFYAGQHPPAILLENVRQSTRQELAIVEAIRDGDGDEAERRMRMHIILLAPAAAPASPSRSNAISIPVNHFFSSRSFSRVP